MNQSNKEHPDLSSVFLVYNAYNHTETFRRDPLKFSGGYRAPFFVFWSHHIQNVSRKCSVFLFPPHWEGEIPTSYPRIRHCGN